MTASTSRPVCSKCLRVIRYGPPVERPDGRTVHRDCPWRPSLRLDDRLDPERRPSTFCG